jgi:hypothetical protein
LASLGIAVLWCLLALATPRRTYHFAPILAAAAWPATGRMLRGRANPRQGLRAAASGLLMVAVAAMALTAAGALAGPGLVGDSAPVEATAGAVLGALWGFRIATRARPGLFASEPAGPDPVQTKKEHTTGR